MTTATDMLASGFATLPDLIRAHAAERPEKIAVADEAGTITHAALDRRMDRVAAALQRGGVAKGMAVAILAAPSIDDYAAPDGARPAPVVTAPGDAFDIIYSSGTTGWMVNLLTDAPRTDDGWWLLNAKADHARAGGSSQAMRMWNARGELVAEGIQSVAIFA